MEIEEKFGIQVPDEVAEKIATVGDAVDYIRDNQE
jgi:acyl carrier protein